MKSSRRLLHISLAFFLFMFWLALSGIYTAFSASLGVASALICTYAASRIRVVDAEGHPIGLLLRTPLYYPWLLKEIFVDGWSMARVILSPKLPISPTMTTIRARQKTAAGIATFANSVILTPGSVVAKVSGNELTIHALERSTAIKLEQGKMNEQVRRFEGGG